MNKLTVLLPLTAALITACGGAGTPAASTQPATVTGTLAGYSGAATTLELREGTTVLASTALSASGSFTLPLPSAQAVTPYLSNLGSAELYNGEAGAQCTGTLSNSNPSAQAYAFETLWAGNTSYSTLKLVSDEAALTASVSGYAWLYSNQAAVLSGTQTCTEANSSGGTNTDKVTFSAPIKVGWNLIKEQADGVGSLRSPNTNGAYDVNTTVTLTTVNDQATTWGNASAQAQSLRLKNDTVAASVLKHFPKLR